MATIHRFPAAERLELALDLGERRFLPVLGRIEREKLIAEQGWQKSEAHLAQREQHRLRTKQKVDFLGRIAAASALLGFGASLIEVAFSGHEFTNLTFASFAMCGGLCFVVLSIATANLEPRLHDQEAIEDALTEPRWPKEPASECRKLNTSEVTAMSERST